MSNVRTVKRLAAIAAITLIASACSSGPTPWEQHDAAATFYGVDPDSRIEVERVEKVYNERYNEVSDRYSAPEDCDTMADSAESSLLLYGSSLQAANWNAAAWGMGEAMAEAEWLNQNC